MNFELSDDQSGVLTGLDQLLSPFQAAPIEPITHSYSQALDDALAESGFLDIGATEGFTLLDAALVVEQVAHVPQVVECAASAIIAPALPVELGTRPIALLSKDVMGAARFLPQAQLLVVLQDDHVDLIRVDPAKVAPLESLLAYPYGRLTDTEGLSVERFKDVDLVRRRWQIALAVEGASCMAAALNVVLDHVKTRFAFGRPLGSLQAIQHRLAMAAETAESSKWLARRAAWADTTEEAAIAATYVQSSIAQFTYDLHQFSGAMGLTLEYPLHFWSYRLRALAGELGGASAQAQIVAREAWNDAA